ncbi:hypothetical protein HGG78_15675 [Vibrio aestuarianus]|uniref:hypothetical protein n=1 Tax=Vibrio aestuarianus TaxID=28171 RepID=UPI0006A5C6F7|nr:hypothetical protein [Vibrio aestuarianus]KOE84926.1 hypothetical protein ACS86_05950 [Vibrio alginolyticus]MDE1220557.1 hypothetical protein [Vibrio aestuarianus]MDE1252937.1 hypothetical protein [Vibrio aestuarianus]NGZ15178.1 hypothetical protein [Vibrio aestuarianus]NKZ51326.1 hypothetical protein [Vibrio aestuarianus]
MKKLTMCAVAVSALFGTQVNAASLQLTGFIEPVCEITDLSSQALNFGAVTSVQTAQDDITVKCNDSDGATITLTSVEGGLESDDNEDYAIPYTAILTPSVSGLAPITLNAPGGPGLNNVSVSESYSGSTSLATGVSATLSITTTATALWAGGYSDTLTVQITAQ